MSIKMFRQCETIGTIIIIGGIFMLCVSPEISVGIGMVGVAIFFIGRLL